MPELTRKWRRWCEGLRAGPPVGRRRSSQLGFTIPFLLQGCSARELTQLGRSGWKSREVGRRGKWVVITLTDHRGMTSSSPDDWRLLAHKPASARARSPVVSIGQT